MRDIGLSVAPTAIPQNTFVIYGDTRTGKTEFGATFPRPLLIVDVGERGYETVMNMDRSKWFEPDVEPIIKGIDSMSDFAEIVNFAGPLIASGRICSVVADAFTFYCDFYLSKLISLAPGADTRQIYGKLGTHLQFCRNALHQLPVNVVWNCLAAAPETGDVGASKAGGPLIPGSQGPKFAAGVNYLFYSKIVQKKEKGEITEEQFHLRTKQHGLYMAGSRVGLNALPDPFVMGTYADLLPWLGYDVDMVRQSLKPIAAVQPARTVTTRPAARPPVTRTVATRPTNNSAPKAVSPTGK